MFIYIPPVTQANKNLGGAVKEFYRCNKGQKSVGLKLGKLNLGLQIRDNGDRERQILRRSEGMGDSPLLV